MRNLKRALSLLLSSTLVLGMLVMGSSAAGYQDVDASNDHQEAIEVLQTVGIMTGDQNGNFNPDGSITRNEMAVVMAHLLNLDYDYYRGTNPFTDVPEWAAPYVAACAAEGVVAGIGNGQYGGDQKVTAAQASLMIMKALGYFQNAEDFGTDWQVATIRQASYINLFNNINATAESALTRGQVAQLVLNGLKAKMVDFTGDKGIQIGDVTVGYKAEYTYKTSAAVKYNTIDDGTTNIAQNDQYYIQLGEELYNGELKLSNDGTDDYGRPSRVWSFDGKEIGTYAKKELMVASYTTGVSGKEAYELLSAATIREDDLYNYVDGHEGTIVKNDLVRSNTDNLKDTGNGVLTEVYLDNQAKEITIVSINTYLAQANGDYNSKSETISLRVYDSDEAVYITKTVDVEDIPAIADLKEDDFVLVNWASEKNDRASKEITAISDVEVLSNVTVTKFSQSGTATKLTVDGTQYTNSETLTYDKDVLDLYNHELLTDKTYNVYLDQYGYFIGVDLYSGTDNYVFITGYDRTESNLAISTIKAGAIFTDGTMKTIDVKAKASQDNINKYFTETKDANYNFITFNAGTGMPNANRWFSYTVDEDGVYTLKPVTRYTIDKTEKADEIIDCSNVALDKDLGTGRSFGNDDSVFITVDSGAVDTGVAEVLEVTGTYTGVQDVKLALTKDQYVYSVYDKDNYIIAAIVLGEADGNVDNYAYILSDVYSEAKVDGTYYWEFDAVMNGEIKTMTIKSKYEATADELEVNKVQELIMDADGYVVRVEDVTGDDLYDDGKFGDKISGEEVYFITANENELYLEGRTLHYEANGADIGLTFASDAKAVVIQEINDDWTETEFASVKEAYGTLADAKDTDDGILHFTGHVAAVLDSNGVAQWVVFYDDTEVSTGTDPDYGNNGKVKAINWDAGYVNVWADADKTTRPGVEVQVALYQLRDNGYVFVNNYTVPKEGYLNLNSVMNTGDTYKVVCGDYSDVCVAP
ncbi:hypothetical protein HMPREF0866_02174 [Ruminococcaceae bacterium D16]|nr:hypothetical protein HMPREF0866_02174 [Ruminococcaceae bacterium D16]